MQWVTLTLITAVFTVSLSMFQEHWSTSLSHFMFVFSFFPEFLKITENAGDVFMFSPILPMVEPTLLLLLGLLG